LEQSDQRQPDQAADISHKATASPDSSSLASQIGFPIMTPGVKKPRARRVARGGYPLSTLPLSVDPRPLSSIKIRKSYCCAACHFSRDGTLLFGDHHLAFCFGRRW
jgi:hypothetical protein